MMLLVQGGPLLGTFLCDLGTQTDLQFSSDLVYSYLLSVVVPTWTCSSWSK